MKHQSNTHFNMLLVVPQMAKFFDNKRKNQSVTWISVQCSLLFNDEFLELTTVTRGVFLQLLLLCGVRGNHEIPFNINYLSKIMSMDRCRIRNSLRELLEKNFVFTREKEKKERIEEYSTDSTERESVGAVERGEVSNFGMQNEDLGLEAVKAETKSEIQNHKSEFTLEECLKYVEICQSKGEDIKNAKGLAAHLFQTGNADAFILAALYPKKQEELERETYGEPRQFTDEPCKICYGAKMADADGKGFRKCTHCQDEKGKATGFEPLAGNT